ncbi:MAG: aspartate--tRNA ligase [Dethiobacter sp.]|jgi:aspartyl-tRNA synthetase|nr:aspartate--tRNA ligase [Dethiobacter sp.]
MQRDIYCGEVRKEHIGKSIILNGWVQRRRDHGGLIFVDLRDRSGLVQVVFNFEQDAGMFEHAEELRGEYVLAVRGTVVARSEETVNPRLATGDVEVQADKLIILNKAKTPPFYIEDGVDVDENVRLRYRYLDLRRPEMQQNLILRHRVAKLVRDFLDGEGFLEVETPMLTRSTPEGARDYLVPSRVSAGEFYALPQSPQIFKQLLMVAGLEKYFQIVRCFRDEDLRADRQPEFTQIDIELSFCDREVILGLMEKMMAYVFTESLGEKVEIPFPRLSYREAMDRFGSDKPDTRFGLEIRDLSAEVGDAGFKVFAQALKGGGVVKGINARDCGHFSRRELDELTAFIAQFGAKGLAYFFVDEAGVRSPIAKFFSASQLDDIVKVLEARPGDLLLFVADREETALAALGALRLNLGARLGLIDEKKRNFVWVVDFPLLEFDKEGGRYVAIHHPFTSPRDEDLSRLETNPGSVLAKAYDLVLNGVEIGGGSMRIYQREVQEKMFSLLGFDSEAAKEQFGFLMDAFEYGTPPHGGIAFGLDRMVMLMAGSQSIRDVIPFPKTASAGCLMSGAPSEVAQRQLKELHIRIVDAEKSTP